MTNNTTVAHIILERLAKQGITLKFPNSVSGNLIDEHDWAMSASGFDLINNFRDTFDEVCNEVDEQVEAGTIIFTDEGIIIMK